MPKQIKHPAVQKAAKERAKNYNKDSQGRFTKKVSYPSLPEYLNFSLEDQNKFQAMLPPQARVWYQSQFIANPAPINNVLFNPDVAWNTNQENASRMIQDMSIYAPLQERITAAVSQEWSIAPQDEDDPEQQYAADAIEDVIKSYLPSLPDFLLNLNWAIYNGRMGCYLDYQWKFKSGKKIMAPVSYTPVHGDSLIFGTDGEVGYKVGVTNPDGSQEVLTGVEGRYTPIQEHKENEYLSPVERKAWIIHHYNRMAGEWRLWRSAGAKYGLGLRSRLYPIWELKQSVLQFIIQNAARFGAGWLLAYYDAANDKSRLAMQQAVSTQINSTTMLFPRFAPGEQSVEGLEVLNPPSGIDNLHKIMSYFDAQMQQAIKGESLTSDSGSTGLGSNLADQHFNTFARLVKYDTAILEESLNSDFISVLQEFNGFGHLPALKWRFAQDIETPDQKIERALKLYTMGVKISETELLETAGFSRPKETEDITDPLRNEELGEKIGVRATVH